jgi:Tol biopolymer transport system component
MQVTVRKRLFIGILLLLVILSTPSALIPGNTDSSSLGRLAYVKGGNLWVKELPGSQVQRLIINGDSARPSWSPLGQWLAFLRDRELWIVQPSGAGGRTLSPGAQVETFAWSPVSDTLAYITGTGNIHIASVEEWHEREVAAGADSKERMGFFSLAWSPEGKWLAYVREEVREEKPPPDNRSASLWRIRADGSDATELFNTASVSGGLMVASWSPDSQYILFWPVPLFSPSTLADGVSLMVIAAAGGQPIELVDSMLAYSDFLAWSPDGQLLAITVGGGRETWSHKRIAVMELTRKELTYLTDDKTAAFSPAWSPNGQRIAYVAAPNIGFVGEGKEAKAGAAQHRIWMMKRDGSEKRQLTRDAAYRDEQPLWLADGTHILFARLDQNDRVSLWLMRSDGSELQQVVDELTLTGGRGSYYGHIAWDSYFTWWTGIPQRP